ncbi:nudC domain-containing protein 3 isoform X2 [Agrilus planipennis]|uniref:Nuclear migration protein nudC n=1 Tax=Agrilus planipennis TaxID=224129 RepID=A0A7F5RK95_AGRPL|nr:nudC domain-containing protein 3 isoform X1 [Agrilus planipennis]XP_025836423.1 nudC domain-containing protein 3 isoform X2 [Agrilus planipennis]
MNNGNVFDDALFNILKECKTLPTFLDTIFGFLRRRTDFYVVAVDPISPIGLPPGWAENLVKQAFLKYKPHNKRDTETLPESQVPLPTVETEVVTSSIEDQNKSDLNGIDISVNKCINEELKEKSNFHSSESYNGAVYNNYSWSQTITDVDVVIKLPENLTTKNLNVDIGPQKIDITLKGTGESLFSGILCQKIKYNDVLWALDKRKLNIHLDKVQEMWWNCLLQNEPKLDISKIDCSRPFEELPEDAQAKIEELAWNQERKIQGLPTSQELAMQETLKKAWNAEGSPFSGPFDLSKVEIN